MLHNKLQEIRKREGLTQQQLADKLGVTQQTVWYYENGKREMKSSVLISMAEALGCTVAELLGVESFESAFASSDDNFVDVPLLGSIAAGKPIEMMEVDDTYPVPSAVHELHPMGFLLRVEGESMNRILPNGCYAYIDPCETVESPGKPYAVCVNGYNATIKRVRRLSNGFELSPDSTDPTYRPKIYDYNVPGTDSVTVIGEVVWHMVPFDWEY